MAAVKPIRAAGGVLARDHRLAVVHRPRYDDWSLPKGKLVPGEHPLAGACREVREETGVRPIAGARLPSVCYPVRTPQGVAEKEVDFWAMAAAENLGFAPTAEVDQVRWLSADETMARLSYPHDIAVLTAWTELPAVTATVLVIRHGRAGRRADWAGPDDARPLDRRGGAQAGALAEVLACYAPDRLVSAVPRRCQETLAPLAATAGRPIQVEPAFNDDADPVAAAGLIRRYAQQGGASVICGQGALMPAALGALTQRPPGQFPAGKGNGWAVGFAGAVVVATDRIRLADRP
jgi:8-oxo-(d)GTP phosphatase